MRSINFAWGSKKLVSGSANGIIAVWEWEKLDTPILLLEGHDQWVMSIAVSFNGERIFSGSRDGTLRIWNGNTGLEIEKFELGSPVLCVAINAGDQNVAIGCESGTVKVLDSCTEETAFVADKAHSTGVASIAYSPDGRRLATGACDMTLGLWDTESWDAIGTPVKRHCGIVTCVAFSPHTHQLVSASTDGTICFSEISPTNSALYSSSQQFMRERAMFSTDRVNSIAFTFDGEKIISGSSTGFVRIWDATSDSKEVHKSVGHSGPVHCVSISGDGQRVASGSRDKKMRLWNTLTGAQIETPLEGSECEVKCVSFSPDGQQLASGSSDRTLRLWNTETFDQIGVALRGHSRRVSCVSFSFDGHRLISGSYDKTVRQWNAANRQQIGEPLLGHSNIVISTAESSNGCFVVSRVWKAETIIWDRFDVKIVWKSEDHSGNSKNEISNDEAESIIRSTGQEIPHVWPSSFPEYSGEMYCEKYSIIANVHEEKILLGNLPSYAITWHYDANAKVFAAGLQNCSVSICRLVE